MVEDYFITPWNVQGKIDYEYLIKKFGTSSISGNLIKKVRNLHPLIRRGLYFSHRDFELWINDAESGKKTSILTGRGPSEKMHLGHIVPLLLAKSLQKLYKCNVYIPISEDEKFFVKSHLTISEVKKFAEDNILDILSVGFEHGKTFVMRDFSYPELYEKASFISKLITYSEVKAIFGLKPQNNIGWSFYPAVQTFHILWPQFREGAHRTLVPVGIDQDPFVRLARDIASHQSLNFVKPSAIYNKFLPSLKGETKMSSSKSDAEQSTIYLSDSPETVRKKINKYAFSGGKNTIEEHRKYGGNPEIDVSFIYLKYLFEEDDEKIEKIEKDYRSGKILTSELKSILVDKVNDFLYQHKKKKENIKKHIEKFILTN